MASYNKVTLIGNLTRPPEIKYVASGNAVTSFSIAVNRKTKAADEVMYVDIIAWDSPGRKLAEICNKFLDKGSAVLVEGRLSIRSYETKDGEKRKATEIVASDVQFLAGKKDGASESYKAPASTGEFQQSFEDEIPF